MGAYQSVRVDEDDQDEDEEEEEAGDRRNGTNELVTNSLVKKVLEQEPEMLPCHASASPLSPQLSFLGTPRLGPSIKVWDPYHVLAPPPPLPPPPQFNRTFSFDAIHDDRTVTELYFISHGDWHMNLRPDLIAGQCPEAALTSNGKRQARALAVFLRSQGIRFNAVYTSPLERARSTAVSVCQEMNFVEEQIQSCEALVDMSHGHWEGCHRSEIYTPELSSLMERFQPDFSAPSGESLRQVEFRMSQFLNKTILGLPDKFIGGITDNSLPFHNEKREFLHQNPPQLDLVQRQQWQGGIGGTRKKSGKSRLQIVTTTTGGDQEADDEMSPRVTTSTTTTAMDHQGSSSFHGMLNGTSVGPPSSGIPPSSAIIGVFTHCVPIKCLLTGILGCSPVMSNRICIEDSSVTLLQHSWKMGWQIKRLNDTAHLRLL